MSLMLKEKKKKLWLKEAGKLEFSNIRGFFLLQLICSADFLREVATAGLLTRARGLKSRNHSSVLGLLPLLTVLYCLMPEHLPDSNCFLKLKVCFSWDYTMLVGLVFCVSSLSQSRLTLYRMLSLDN